MNLQLTILTVDSQQSTVNSQATPPLTGMSPQLIETIDAVHKGLKNLCSQIFNVCCLI